MSDGRGEAIASEPIPGRAPVPLHVRPRTAAARAHVSTVVAVLAVLGAGNVVLATVALRPEHVWLKDLRQDWLQARAIRAGIPAYAPLPVLAATFIAEPRPPEYPTPTLHPPFAAVACMPLGAMSFPVAARCWFVLQLAVVLGTVWLCVTSAMPIAVRTRLAPVLALVALSWHPFAEDMILGQFGTFVMALMAVAWLRIREGRDGAGGAALGIALALKLTGWPVLVWLALERRWRGVAAAICAAAGANLLSSVVLGPDVAWRYYHRVLASAAVYAEHDRNISLASLASRVFSGTRSGAMFGTESSPLIAAPWLARPAGLVLLALVVTTAALVARAGPPGEGHDDTGFGIMTCVSVVASPLAWSSYLVVAVIPVVVAARALRRARAGARLAAAFVAVGLLVPADTLHRALETGARVGFARSLTPLVHLGALLALAAWLAIARGLAVPTKMATTPVRLA